MARLSNHLKLLLFKVVVRFTKSECADELCKPFFKNFKNIKYINLLWIKCWVLLMLIHR